MAEKGHRRLQSKHREDRLPTRFAVQAANTTDRRDRYIGELINQDAIAIGGRRVLD